MQRFVIVIDTQRDFMAADGALSVPGADALIAPMTAWLAGLDPAETAGVLFTFDTHVPEIYARSPEAETFPIHCVRDTAGWRNVLDPGAINPAIPVYRLEKGVFDMWAETGLVIEDTERPGGQTCPREIFFDALKEHGVGEVAVIGVAADYCVRWAIEGLVGRGFDVTVIAELTKGIDRPIDVVVKEDFPADRVQIA
jgi:nicotinamidase/pyrazinamidase